MSTLWRWIRFVAASCWLVVAAILLFESPAAADNCSAFSDCFGQSGAASEAAFGLTFLAVLSLMIDFIPIVGDVKGVVEMVTGKDLLTGEELEDWERALGLVGLIPGGDLFRVAKIGKGVKVGGDVVGVAGPGVRHIDGVAPPRSSVPPTPARVADVPGAPRQPGVPHAPEVPRQPDGVPRVSDVPGVPRVPDAPDVPHAPEVPRQPDGVPRASDVPGVPRAPDVPRVPDAPDVPRPPDGVPRAPDAPGVPDAPDVPCLLYTSPSPRDKRQSRMPSSA